MLEYMNYSMWISNDKLTPYHSAVINRHPDAIQLLLELGNKTYNNFETGKTPLYLATFCKYFDGVVALLNIPDIDINKCVHDMSPFRLSLDYENDIGTLILERCLTTNIKIHKWTQAYKFIDVLGGPITVTKRVLLLYTSVDPEYRKHYPQYGITDQEIHESRYTLYFARSMVSRMLLCLENS
jgi:ankyrin repeat protein